MLTVFMFIISINKLPFLCCSVVKDEKLVKLHSFFPPSWCHRTLSLVNQITDQSTLGTMAQQEDGWPLGLQPLNVRVGLVRNRDYSGSISFNTLLTGSPTSFTDSSSDLDTESTGSFFHDKSITLGSLIGASSILELSGRSAVGRRAEALRSRNTTYRSRTWFFSLCSRGDDSSDGVNNPPSLGHFLEVERRAATDYRRTQSPNIYEADEYARARNDSEPNPLFIDGRIAPPRSTQRFDSDDGGTSSQKSLDHGNGYAVPVLLKSCMCGRPSN